MLKNSTVSSSVSRRPLHELRPAAPSRTTRRCTATPITVASSARGSSPRASATSFGCRVPRGLLSCRCYSARTAAQGPRRLAWPRTRPFQGRDRGFESRRGHHHSWYDLPGRIWRVCVTCRPSRPLTSEARAPRSRSSCLLSSEATAVLVEQAGALRLVRVLDEGRTSPRDRRFDLPDALWQDRRSQGSWIPPVWVTRYELGSLCRVAWRASAAPGTTDPIGHAGNVE